MLDHIHVFTKTGTCEWETEFAIKKQDVFNCEICGAHNESEVTVISKTGVNGE